MTLREFVSTRRFDDRLLLHPDSTWPRISIVTPCLNQAEFLERTILSVLNQDYPNLEYIVIDGGSTDGSTEIIRKYKKYLAYCVSEPDGGQADALNKGYGRSTGAILGWQNSDDVYLSGAFHSVINTFRQLPDADLVFGNIHFIDDDDEKCGELRFTPFRRSSLIYEGTMLSNQGAFWTRELFQRAGPLDSSLTFSMDYEFYLRASAHGKLVFTRRFLGAFRLQRESKSATISGIGRSEHLTILRGIGIPEPSSVVFRGRRLLSLLRRMCHYAAQGDWTYVFQGLMNRWGFGDGDGCTQVGQDN